MGRMGGGGRGLCGVRGAGTASSLKVRAHSVAASSGHGTPNYLLPWTQLARFSLCAASSKCAGVSHTGLFNDVQLTSSDLSSQSIRCPLVDVGCGVQRLSPGLICRVSTNSQRMCVLPQHLPWGVVSDPRFVASAQEGGSGKY